MNMSFYTAAVGATQQQERLSVQANNIANVNTAGFRAEKVAFGELMNRNVTGINEAQLPKGTGSRVIQTTVDFTSAAYQDSGRALDFAIVGDGFFALYDIESEEVSFTRDGAFVLAEFLVEPDENAVVPEGEEAPAPLSVWRLSDNEGRCVLDAQGNFIEVDSDNIRANKEDTWENDLSLERLNIGVFDYAIREGMQHLDSARFLALERNGQLYAGTGTVRQGLLEMSNTDLAQEFVKVIETQRAYSFMLRMMTATDEIETTINGLAN